MTDRRDDYNITPEAVGDAQGGRKETPGEYPKYLRTQGGMWFAVIALLAAGVITLIIFANIY